MDTFIAWDENAFRYLNQGIANAFFDFLMPWLSDKFIWIPLYAFFIYLIIKKFGEQSVRLIVIAIVTIVISDRTSSGLIKPAVERYRPCQVAEMNTRLPAGIGCNSKYGFVSSHASNCFAIAMLLSLTGVIKSRNGLILLWLWVFMVSFSRIYNGVHYPGDILGGWVVGGSVAAFSAWMFNRKKWLKTPVK